MGRVYLAEGSSIQVYSADLATHIYSITSLTKTEGVAVTRDSAQLTLYSSDRTNGSLTKWILTESGNNITANNLDPTFGAGGAVSLSLGLRSVEIDPDGNVWVAGRIMIRFIALLLMAAPWTFWLLIILSTLILMEIVYL